MVRQYIQNRRHLYIKRTAKPRTERKNEIIDSNSKKDLGEVGDNSDFPLFEL